MSLSSYPNPANPTATIRFAFPQTAPVSLVIYNLLGQSVRTLLENAVWGPGAYALRWDGKDGVGQDLASGLYLCRLEAGGRMQAKKLLLLR